MTGRLYDLERERLKRQGRPLPPWAWSQSELHRACLALAVRAPGASKQRSEPPPRHGVPWARRPHTLVCLFLLALLFAFLVGCHP